MLENQYIEWKLIWKDDYLKWLCAFANTTGGLLYIGVRDDGEIVGVKNAAELVEMIPKKAKDILGIMVEAKIKMKKKLKYVCIKVDEHNTPVSCRGKYYLRSGSNTYEAIGVELNRLLLRKSGLSWETSTVSKSDIKLLSPKIIDYYKTLAYQTKRLPIDVLKTDNETLLRNLKLYNEDNLTKSAILLFSDEPESIISGSYIKIGLFAPDNITLIKEDEVHGSILTQIDSTLNLIYNKYIDLITKYKDKNKNLFIPRLAMKEIITNAVEHKAYDTRTPILIGVYNNKITVWNPTDGFFIKSSSFYNMRASISPNPLIANAFYRCGLTYAWGIGIEKARKLCVKENIPLPKFQTEDNGVLVRCNPNKEHLIKIRETLTQEVSLRQKLLNEIALDQSIKTEQLQKLLKKN